MALAKPQLRGLLSSSLKKHAAVCAVFTFATTALAQIFIRGDRIKKYEEFYKHYDAEKDFERMRDAGVFHSVKPKGAEKADPKKKR